MLPMCKSMSLRPLLVALSLAVAACGEEKRDNPYTLKEVIDVQGPCAEDHVGQQDHYMGQIVRWQSVKSGEILTYGFLSKGDPFKHVFEEVSAPTVYHTPLIISFRNVEVDTSLPKWVLHGVSNRGDSARISCAGRSWTFSKQGQAECAEFIADRRVNEERLLAPAQA
jgi:hypothetical protein